MSWSPEATNEVHGNFPALVGDGATTGVDANTADEQQALVTSLLQSDKQLMFTVMPALLT